MNKISSIMMVVGGMVFAIGVGLKLTGLDSSDLIREESVSTKTSIEVDKPGRAPQQSTESIISPPKTQPAEIVSVETKQPDVTVQPQITAAQSQSTVARSAYNKIYIPRTNDERKMLLKAASLGWEQIPKFYAPSNGLNDWRSLQPSAHWSKGRSAYQLAFVWENANPDLPGPIKSLFGSPVELLVATPEHKTSLPGGSRGSQSDVLAFVRAEGKICAVTVEAKVDETFGPEVGEWFTNPSSGKQKRLKYISNKLGLPYPPTDEVRALRYQLLHRTASAIIEAERFQADCAIMVAHSFSKELDGFEDFVKFLNALGIQSVEPGKLYTSARTQFPLRLGWVIQ